MNEFGIALKEARTNARKKLREVADHLKLSIGYISDIEQGRKAPPESDVVRKLQKFLSVDDDSLVRLADEARTKRPVEVIQKFQERPRLTELFFRVRDMSDEDLEKLIKKVSDD